MYVGIYTHNTYACIFVALRVAASILDTHTESAADVNHNITVTGWLTDGIHLQTAGDIHIAHDVM